MNNSDISDILKRLKGYLFDQECAKTWHEEISEEELEGLFVSIEDHIQGQLSLFNQLTAISVELSGKKSIAGILEKILTSSREMTNAEAGTLYLVDFNRKCLTFEIVQNSAMNLCLRSDRSCMDTFDPVPLEKDGLPNTSNVSSYAAICGTMVCIPDVYDARGFDFTGTKAYDQKTGYRSRSMLVMPMRDHEDRVIGVLQIINALNPDTGKVAAFTSEHEVIVEALASQAAISLTKTRLIQDLEKLLENLREMHQREKAVLKEKSIVERQRAESLSNLALSVAHQIRNPIMTIGGFINLARRNLDDHEKVSSYLDYILDSALRLESMARSVDNYASIGKPDIRRVIISSFITPACRKIMDRARETGIVLDIILEKGADLQVMADPEQMEKVAFIILENALEAVMEETGGQNPVRISAYRQGSRVTLAFQDQGRGIAPKDIAYVFDPFFTTRPDKAGMGLTIARRMLVVNRGELHVESPEGKGVKAVVILPADDDGRLRTQS